MFVLYCTQAEASRLGGLKGSTAAAFGVPFCFASSFCPDVAKILDVKFVLLLVEFFFWDGVIHVGDVYVAVAEPCRPEEENNSTAQRCVERKGWDALNIDVEVDFFRLIFCIC